MSTPTDALIEKMARAMALADGWPDLRLFNNGQLKGIIYRKLARAAYEAEHEETKG